MTTTDPRRAKRLWPAGSSDNIAAATGCDHLFDVLDIDHPDLDWWQRTTGFTVPPTWHWRTGRGGHQLAFQPMQGLGNRVKRVPFADTRAKGGLVILPPSRNRYGVYLWIAPPGSVPIAPWPSDLLAALMPPTRPAPSMAARPVGLVTSIPPTLLRWAEAGAPGGERNARAFWLSCRLRAYGATDHEGLDLALRFAAACVPPMDPNEAEKVWRSSEAHQGYEPTRSLPAPQRRQGVSVPRPPRREAVPVPIPPRRQAVSIEGGRS